MNSLRKVFHVATLAALMGMATLVLGQSLTPNPSTVPKRAFINADSDEIHYYFQVVTYTIGVATAGATTVTLNLPADGSITVADPDDDASYHDGVFITDNDATAITINAATAASITVSAAAALTPGQVINFIFPIETDSTLATTSKVPYTLSTGDASGDDGFIGTDSVSFAAEVRPVNLFVTNLENDGDGSTSTDNKGEYHPSTAAAFTAAMTNFVNDSYGAGNFANPAAATPDPWSGMVLDGTDNNPAASMEVYYVVWASQNEGLKYLNTGVAEKLYRYNAGTESYADNFVEGAAMNDALRVDGLPEGVHYIYITSNLSADWAIGQSDSLIVKHYPVFVDPDAALTPLWQYDDVTDGAGGGRGQGVDYDHNSTFAPDGADDAQTLYLDTGNIIGIDGNFVAAGNSYDNVRIYWHGQDVDDPSATVQVFYSTSNSLTAGAIQVDGSGNVTGLTGATEITSSPMDLDGPTNYITYTISQDPLQAAGTYYFYLVANDLTNQTLQIITDYDAAVNPIALTTYIKHSPYFEFQDVYAAEAAAGTADEIPIDTETSEHVIISWGEMITSARDIDATPADPLTIDLYYVYNDVDVGGSDANDGTYSTLVADPLDPSTLTGSALATLMATVVDTSDEQLDNAYMWEIRNATPALTVTGADVQEYFIYAVVSQGGDEVVVQYNSDGFPGPALANEDDRGFQFAHGDFFQAISPVPNTSTELVVRDYYNLAWNAFDLDGAGAGLVQVFIAPTSAGVDYSALDWTNAAYDGTNGLYWIDVTGAMDGATQPTNAQGFASSTGSGTLDVSALTDDTGGAIAVRPALWGPDAAGGNDAGAIGTEYDVWYFFTKAATFTAAETPTKAQGTLFFSIEDPGTVQNIRIVPNKPLTAVVGDQITFAVEVNSGGANVGALTIAIDVPADNLSVVDQGSGPFSGFIGTFNTATLNNASTVGSTVQLDLALTGTAQAMAWGTTVATFKVQVADNPAGESPLHISVDFVDDSDTRVTSIKDANIMPVMTSWDTPSADVSLVRPGKIYGIVEVEGREDSPAQDVSLLLVPTGSISPITASAYVDANDDDSDGSNGAQLTLDSDGVYELTQVPTGEYDLIARKGGFLDQLESSVWVYPFGATEVNFLDGNKLFGGDIAGYDDDGDANTLELGDNQVDAANDEAAMTLAMNTTPASAAWNALADITGDNLVWADDWAILIKNKNRTSEGVTYKLMDVMPNEGVLAMLAEAGRVGDVVTFAVDLRNVNSLRGYAVRLAFDPGQWELMGHSDLLLKYGETAQVHRQHESGAFFVSATEGSPVYDEQLGIMNIQMRAKNSHPQAPRLTEVSVVDANSRMTSAILSGGGGVVPEEFTLSQNFPNPFNPTTTIEFGLPEASDVKLAVYNVLGQQVAVLASGRMDAGHYSALWNGTDYIGRKVSSGVYFYRLLVGNKVMETRKMLLLQ